MCNDRLYALRQAVGQLPGLCAGLQSLQIRPELETNHRPTEIDISVSTTAEKLAQEACPVRGAGFQKEI